MISPGSDNEPSQFLYIQIAEKMAAQITQGTFKFGQLCPSVRNLSQQMQVSVSSVLKAYAILENQGFIEARPQSGYYVSYRKETSKPVLETFYSQPQHFQHEELIIDIHKASRIPGIIPLGASIPSADILPGNQLARIMSALCRQSKKGLNYDFPPGNRRLREQIAQLEMTWQIDTNADQIIITNGVTEAIYLSLSVLAKPGDIILTESPTYFGILQLIENMGMTALEIPTSPQDGISIEHVTNALKSHPIAACILIPNIHNPLGCTIPDHHKQRLYTLLAEHQTPLIEDDVYGDLYFGLKRPIPIKACDTQGIVIYCGSFSKTVAPGYRVGWVDAGPYYEAILHQKLMVSLATATLPQMVMAEFLETGGYRRSVKTLRKQYREQVAMVSNAVLDYFPKDIKITRPQGGFLLWVELPQDIDAIQLQKDALKHNINLASGPIFSTRDAFQNYIRISCGFPWSQETEQAVKTLGILCKSAMQ